MINEINGRKVQTGASENQKIGKLFYWLAAANILQIISSAVLSFFVAPASLFVSRSENEAFGWMAAAFAGIVLITIGASIVMLSIIAANAFRKEKVWRKSIGVTTAVLAIFAFPCGTVLSAILLPKIFNARK